MSGWGAETVSELLSILPEAFDVAPPLIETCAVDFGFSVGCISAVDAIDVEVSPVTVAINAVPSLLAISTSLPADAAIVEIRRENPPPATSPHAVLAYAVVAFSAAMANDVAVLACFPSLPAALSSSPQTVITTALAVLSRWRDARLPTCAVRFTDYSPTPALALSTVGFAPIPPPAGVAAEALVWVSQPTLYGVEEEFHLWKAVKLASQGTSAAMSPAEVATVWAAVAASHTGGAAIRPNTRAEVERAVAVNPAVADVVPAAFLRA